jgi:hypothetical protein
MFVQQHHWIDLRTAVAGRRGTRTWRHWHTQRVRACVRACVLLHRCWDVWGAQPGHRAAARWALHLACPLRACCTLPPHIWLCCTSAARPGAPARCLPLFVAAALPTQGVGGRVVACTASPAVCLGSHSKAPMCMACDSLAACGWPHSSTHTGRMSALPAAVRWCGCSWRSLHRLVVGGRVQCVIRFDALACRRRFHLSAAEPVSLRRRRTVWGLSHALPCCRAVSVHACHTRPGCLRACPHLISTACVWLASFNITLLIEARAAVRAGSHASTRWFHTTHHTLRSVPDPCACMARGGGGACAKGQEARCAEGQELPACCWHVARCLQVVRAELDCRTVRPFPGTSWLLVLRRMPACPCRASLASCPAVPAVPYTRRGLQ